MSVAYQLAELARVLALAAILGLLIPAAVVAMAIAALGIILKTRRRL